MAVGGIAVGRRWWSTRKGRQQQGAMLAVAGGCNSSNHQQLNKKEEEKERRQQTTATTATTGSKAIVGRWSLFSSLIGNGIAAAKEGTTVERYEWRGGPGEGGIRGGKKMTAAHLELGLGFLMGYIPDTIKRFAIMTKMVPLVPI